MSELSPFLEGLKESKFWGEVTIKFVDGHPTLAKKEEQIKLTNKTEVSSRKTHRDFHDPQEGGHGKCDRSGD
jgi:hypothetical protein